MTEEYRDINDFPNYQVSNLGNVRNKTRGNVLNPMIRIKNKITGYGCYVVGVTDTEGKQKKVSIHRLVALAFLPNPENKKDVDHIDRDTTNNNLSNLRWATRTENNLNTKIRSDNASGHKGVYWIETRKKWRAEICINKNNIFIGSYNTIEEAIKAREDFTY
jgi:hypothetical protein